jgi:hypothetical protein
MSEVKKGLIMDNWSRAENNLYYPFYAWHEMGKEASNTKEINGTEKCRVRSPNAPIED